MSINSKEFVENPEPLTMRRCIGRFLTGVAVVTADSDEEQVGMTINSLNSISLDPPILMISLNFGTRTTDAIESRDAFAISILRTKQEAVARQFATAGGARFEVGNFDTLPSGIPVVSEALAQFGCEVIEKNTVGDHRVFFGKVTHCRDQDGSALSFNGGQFGEFRSFGHDPIPWHA